MTAYLHKTLLPAVTASDRGAIDEAMRNALLLNPDLMELSLDYTGGHLETHRTQQPAAPYPQWFAELEALRPIRQQLRVGDATMALVFAPTVPLPAPNSRRAR